MLHDFSGSWSVLTHPWACLFHSWSRRFTSIGVQPPGIHILWAATAWARTIWPYETTSETLHLGELVCQNISRLSVKRTKKQEENKIWVYKSTIKSDLIMWTSLLTRSLASKLLHKVWVLCVSCNLHTMDFKSQKCMRLSTKCELCAFLAICTPRISNHRHVWEKWLWSCLNNRN